MHPQYHGKIKIILIKPTETVDDGLTQALKQLAKKLGGLGEKGQDVIDRHYITEANFVGNYETIQQNIRALLKQNDNTSKFTQISFCATTPKIGIPTMEMSEAFALEAAKQNLNVKRSNDPNDPNFYFPSMKVFMDAVVIKSMAIKHPEKWGGLTVNVVNNEKVWTAKNILEEKLHDAAPQTAIKPRRKI